MSNILSIVKTSLTDPHRAPRTQQSHLSILSNAVDRSTRNSTDLMFRRGELLGALKVSVVSSLVGVQHLSDTLFKVLANMVSMSTLSTSMPHWLVTRLLKSTRHFSSCLLRHQQNSLPMLVFAHLRPSRFVCRPQFLPPSRVQCKALALSPQRRELPAFTKVSILYGVDRFHIL